MAFIHLERFDSATRGCGRYNFDPETHAYFFTPCATEAEASARTSGYADECEVGVFARRRVFVTLHVVDDRVAASVDGRMLLWPGPLVATRRTLAPFLRRFEVTERGARLLRFDYLYDDPPGFPGSLATDLFRLIAETTASDFSIRRFIGRRGLSLGPS